MDEVDGILADLRRGVLEALRDLVRDGFDEYAEPSLDFGATRRRCEVFLARQEEWVEKRRRASEAIGAAPAEMAPLVPFDRAERP